MVAPSGSGTVGFAPSLFTTRNRPETVHAVDWTTVQRIRQELGTDCASVAATVTPQELEQAWLTVVTDKRRQQGGHPMDDREKECIRMRVMQSTQELDFMGGKGVDLDMWAQHVLLTRASPALRKALRQMNWLLEAALHLCPGILVGLQHAMEVATADITATESSTALSKAMDVVAEDVERSLPCSEVVGIFGRKLWHLRPGARGCSKAERREFSYESADDFVKETVNAMGVAADSSVTPGEFLSLCLGRREWEVTLHLYDLSRGAASRLSPWLLDQKVEGVWHTGIVVYGREYYFGGEIYTDLPGQTGFGPPMLSVSLGYTLRHREELHAFVGQRLGPLFRRDTYDAAFNNCNHFTDQVSMYLLGKHIPEEVLGQPEMLLRSTLGRALRPILTFALGTCSVPGTSAEEISIVGALAGALGRSGELDEKKDPAAGMVGWWAKADSKAPRGDMCDASESLTVAL